MRAMRLAWSILTLLVCPSWSWSQPPTFTFQTLDLVGIQDVLLVPKSLNDQGEIAAVEQTQGGFSYRVAPSLTTDPIVCDPGVFPRYEFPSRGGPDCTGIDNSATVACNDEHVSVKLYGILQAVDGTCTPFLYPGSRGTIYTGQTTVPGVTLGIFYDPTSPGLLAIQAFSQVTGVTTLLLGPNAQSRIIPTAGNDAGVLVGYGFYDIDTDNSYIYQAWLRDADGTLHDLDTPDGGDFCPVSVNSDGLILGIAGSCGVSGGVAYWVESATDTWYPLTQFPTADTTALIPTGLNSHDEMTGQYVETFATGFPPPDATRHVIHTFLATPVIPLSSPEPEPAPKPRHHKHHKPRTHIVKHWREFVKAHRDHAQEETLGPRCWLPALGDHGTIVLTNGTEHVLGR